MYSLVKQTEDLIILFYLCIFFSLSSVSTALWGYSLTQKYSLYEDGFSPQITWISVIDLIISILSVLTSLFIVYYFIKWFYLSHKTLRKDKNIYFLNFNSRTAIWSWFIPLANLFLPYLVMRENFETWEELSNRGHKNSISIVLLWWLFLLLSIAAGFYDENIVRILYNVHPQKYPINLWPFILPDLLNAFSAALTIIMLRKFKNFYELTVGA